MNIYIYGEHVTAICFAVHAGGDTPRGQAYGLLTVGLIQASGASICVYIYIYIIMCT